MDTHTAGRWSKALASDDTTAREAKSELAGAYWYPAYAFFRASGVEGESAATLTESVLTHLIEDPVDGTPLLREWMLDLAKAALADPTPRAPVLTVDREWSEQRFAGEGTHSPGETFVRRWTLDLLEQAVTTLQAEYEAAGKSDAFGAAQSFLGYTGGAEGAEPYAALAAQLGVSDGAARSTVFDLRKRYREILRAAVADTVATEEQIAAELQALLIQLPAPAETVAPRPVLGRLDPEQLLARGMNSVQMSTAGGLGWTPPTIAEAARLFPGYEVVAMLGHGGMGAVYQARQQSLDRLVALKLLPLEISVDPSFADRFRREARAMAKLNHPNIISVHDFGQTSEGHLFFAMEFVEGASLHDLVHKREGGLPPADALGIIEQVCEALSYAHEQGIVHRDIKPANVMIDGRGRAKIADFGLARITDPSAEQWGQTMTGVIMGTPDYMAPEQKRGMQVDSRADIYSVGVMFYEMLCGETPQGAFELPSQRCGLPKELDAVVTRAIAPQVEKRFQTTAELKQAVATAKPSVLRSVARKSQAAAARQPAAVPMVPIVKAAPVAQGNPLVLWGSIAAGVVVLGAVGAFVFGKGKSKPTPPTSAQSQAAANPAAEEPKAEPQTAASKPPAASPAATLKPAEPKASPAPALVAAGNEKWVDGLAQWFGGKNTNGTSVRENNGGARIGADRVTIQPIPRSAPAFRDQVARVRWHPLDAKGGMGLLVRHTMEAAGGVEYVATIKLVNNVTPRLRLTGAGQPRKVLGNRDWPLAPDFEIDATHTMEFRVVGDLLTATVDGKKVAEVRDAGLAAGHPVITAENVVIESFEYANLDPAAPAPALAAAKPSSTTSAPAPANPGDVLTFGGHRYQLVAEKLKWNEAKAKAEAMGGHLATITSKEENEWVKTHVTEVPGKAKHFFLGAGSQDNGKTWTWLTGEAVDMTLWGGGPDSKGAWLTVLPTKGEWDDVPAEFEAPFLVEWDGDGTAKPASTIATAAPLTKPVDLLALVDVKRDVIKGDWVLKPEGLVISNAGGPQSLRFVATPPEEYDFEMEFTLGEGLNDVSQLLALPGGTIFWKMGHGRSSRTLFSFGALLDGQPPDKRTEARVPRERLKSGQRYRSLVEVRKGSLRALIDGEEVLKWSGDLKRLTMDDRDLGGTDPRRPFLGLSGVSTEITFHKAELRPPGAPAASPIAQATPAPAAAATIAPAFENTLGMKFVPVPITGGPTNGQRVLFSIWETRVQDYQVFADETKREWPKPEPGQAATHPAVNVRWADAQAFCAWLTERERKAGKLGAADSYRLPSDHEWSCAIGISEQEDATKLPDKKAKLLNVFPWGSAWPPPAGAGNYAGEEMQAAVSNGKFPRVKEVLAGYNDSFVDKAPVGSFAPDRFGLYDLSGNVNEWCEDWINEKQDSHGFRGGSFATAKRGELGSSSRTGSGTRYEDVGFRVVLMPGAGSPVGTVAASAPKAEAAPTPPSPAPAKTESEMEKWLAQVDGPQQESYQREVMKPFEAGLAELQKGYLGALDSRISTASTAGQLDVALGWRNELQRFREGGQAVPADDADLATVAAPLVAKALPPLRTQFRTHKAKLDADRLARAKVAFAKYDAVLSPNITLLTQRQRLDDALLLKTKRDEVQKAWLPAASAPAAPAPGAPSTPAPKPLGSGTVATPAPAPTSKAATAAAIRAAAEWVIKQGGQIEVPGKKITKLEELPAGPLAVTAVIFRLNNAAVPGAELQALTALGAVTNIKVEDWNAPDSTLTFLQAFGNVGLLDFVGCPQLTDAMLEALPAMPNLGRLSLQSCQGITGKGFAKLKSPKLADIDLNKIPVTDEGLAAISRHEGLKSLVISGPAITDAGVAHLERLRALTSLKLIGTSVTPAALSFLGKRKEFTLLEYLNAASPDFVANAQAIAKIVPNLPTLVVTGKASGPEATRALLGFKGLRSLQWGGSEMNDATFGELAALTDLEDLSLRGAPLTDAAMDTVLALKKLTILDFCDNPELTDAGLLKLKPLKKLKRVHFSRTKATEAGAAELKKAIPGVQVFR